MRGRVLIVDDDKSMCDALAAGLKRRGFDPATRTTGGDALLAISAESFDAVVTDMNMRGFSGIDLCARIVANRPDTPVIVITAFGSLEAAIAAIRAGAYDFLTKPFEIDALGLALDRATQHRALREEVKRLRRAVADTVRSEDLLGASAPMRALFDLIERAAESEASVLITGESGTGKELVARALHRRGKRKDAPFLTLNCAAVPEPLLESELFGHARGVESRAGGASPDARTARVGLFQQASGGTLFLDEIGDMPMTLQPKLLRALQEKSARPVGGDAEIPFDVRIICATHRDLEAAVEERLFREDLFFRVNVVHIDVPPLRARAGDVLLMAQAFLERFAARAQKKVLGLTSAAAERLLAFAWPGNVRELQNCIERAVALTQHEQLTVDDLPEKIRNYRQSHFIVADDDPKELLPMDEVERRYIKRVIEVAGGNKALAARILGFDRTTLYRKLQRFGEAGAGPEA